MATPSLDEATTKEVLRQVEFYFSDSNLARDKFLSKTVASSEDGMVSLALICSFKKMRGYLKLEDAKQDQIPEDTLKAVADTLAKSASLKLSEDGKKVGRVGPLKKPEELVEQLDERTIAASSLPFDVSRDALSTFFSHYGQVTSLRLPNHLANKKVFCGTALVEFSTVEEAEKVLGQSLEFEGVLLELKPKKEFDEERDKKLAEFRAANPRWNADENHNSSPQAEYTKGLIVAFKLKSISTGDGAEKNGNQESVEDGETDSKAAAEETSTTAAGKTTEEGQEKALKEAVVDAMDTGAEQNGNQESVKDDETGSKAAEENQNDSGNKETEIEEESNKDVGEKDVKEGNRFDLAACKNDKNVVMREDLKAVFSKFGGVKFIDFKMGEDSGYVRFEKPEAGQKARAAAVLSKEGGLIVKNFVAYLEPVSGDRESEYWAQLIVNQDRHRGSFGNRGGRGGRFHRGGKHHRSRDNDSGRGGGRNKFQKVGA